MTQYNDITRFFAILSLLFLFSCQSGSVERQRNGDERFKTSAPSLIYFKNIRSLKYQNDRDTKSQMDFYQPRSFLKTSNRPMIYPVIVHNWLEDESYLIFKKKNISDTAKVYVEGEPGKEMTPLRWPGVDYLEQMEFVLQIEDLLKNNKKMVIKDPETDTIPLEYSELEASNFRTVIQDFLNLTESASSRAKK